MSREQQLQEALRELLVTIDVHTNLQSNQIDRAKLDPCIDMADAVLADGWIPEEEPNNKAHMNPSPSPWPLNAYIAAVDGYYAAFFACFTWSRQ